MDNVTWKKPLKKDEVFKDFMNLAALNHFDEIILYWIDKEFSFIMEKQTNEKTFQMLYVPIEEHSPYLACRAAYHKKMISIPSLNKYIKENENLQIANDICSVVVVPIVEMKIVNNEIQTNPLLVVELCKKTELIFLEADINYIIEFSKWYSIYLQQKLASIRESEIYYRHEHIYSEIVEYLSEKITFNDVLNRLMFYAKTSINAGYVFYFERNIDTECFDFYEENVCWKERDNSVQMTKAKHRFKIFDENTFLGQLIAKHESINVEMIGLDMKTGLTKQVIPKSLIDKEILQSLPRCMEIRTLFIAPVKIHECLLGILVFVNKCGGYDCRSKFLLGKFPEDDERIIQQLTDLLGIAIYYDQLSKKIAFEACEAKMIESTFGTILQSKTEEVITIMEHVRIPNDFHLPEWNGHPKDEHKLLSFVFRIFQNICAEGSQNHPLTGFGAAKNFLTHSWILHRNNPYHNFETTLLIARTVFSILSLIDDEGLDADLRIAVMAASLLYYCDHSGLENSFFKTTKHIFFRTFKDNPEEYHRLTVGRMVLRKLEPQQPSEQYTNFVKIVEKILIRARKYRYAEYYDKLLRPDSHQPIEIVCLILRCGLNVRYLCSFQRAMDLFGKYHKRYKNIVHQLEDFPDMKKEYAVRQKGETERHVLALHELEYMKKFVKPPLQVLVQLFPKTEPFMRIFENNFKGFTLMSDDGVGKIMWNPCVAYQNIESNNAVSSTESEESS